MLEIDWADEYHLKLFDYTKRTDKLFWLYDLEIVKLPKDDIMDEDNDMYYRDFIYNKVLNEWERKQFVFKCWYFGEQGCDRMLVWDRLALVYSDLTNNITIINNQQRYMVYRTMVQWCTTMIGHMPLTKMCKCVVIEAGELFPSECDQSEGE